MFLVAMVSAESEIQCGIYILLETMGSPALGHGSNCRLSIVSCVAIYTNSLYIQCVFQVLINLHDSCLVTASVAVVGGCAAVSFVSRRLSRAGYEPEKMVTTLRSCDQLYPSITS